ncbi:MAG TPA: ABC transporter ATP-binding protein [Xanthobacteraceae bacterium]
MAADAVLLRVMGLGKRFGGVQAVQNVDFDVRRGEVIGLIGPNGAGKTTLFSLIGGAEKPSTGTIAFEGRLINGLRPNRIARLGIARTFQIVRPLARLTVLENVMVGAYCRLTSSASARELALHWLEFTGLVHRRNALGRSLTIADRKRLEITRALATQPRLLLLDEVMAGLTPTETAAAVELLQRLRATGLAMIIIEHVMRVIMSVSDRVIVLNHGQKIGAGDPQSVADDPAVIRAYLGGDGVAAG